MRSNEMRSASRGGAWSRAQSRPPHPAHQSAASHDTTDAATASRSLRAAGLRCTMARVCVWQALDAAHGAVSADVLFRMLLERGTHMSIGTVYRVLGLFESRDLVVRQRDAERKASYRLKQHTSDLPVRLTCVSCGHSVCSPDATLVEVLEKRCRELGWVLAGDEIDVRVHCANCCAAEGEV